MQNLTGKATHTSEQHKDHKDAIKIYEFIKERSPFSFSNDLINISTGVHAHTAVNVHEAKEKGIEILEDMDGKSPGAYTF